MALRFAILFSLATLASGLNAQSSKAPIVFHSLAAGERFTCGLDNDGKAFCWGQDNFGQLGTGEAEDRCTRSIYALGPCARAPMPVAGGHKFTRLFAGDNHACAIDASKALWCWGANSGQLGVVTESDNCRLEGSGEESLPVPCSRVPVRVPIERPVVSVAAGEYQTCAVDDSAALWCWPMSREGNPMPKVFDRPITSIVGGGNYFCAETSDDGLRCWRSGDPVDTLRTLTGLKTLTASAGHACALDKEGRAWCWASDADGALGIGQNEHKKYDVVPPTQVVGAHRFEFLATGATRTCGVDAAGALWCWGRVPEATADDRCLDSNYIGDSNDCVTHPVHVQAHERFVGIAIGGRHQCALTTANAPICWGNGEAGQLGDGALYALDAPVLKPVAVRTQGISRTEAHVLDVKARTSWLLTPRGLAVMLSVLILAFAAFRAAPSIRRWWRADAAPASAPAARFQGMGGPGTVLLGWLLLIWFMWPSGSGAHDDVAAGLAGLAFLIGGGVALALALIGGVISLLAMRRHRGAIAPRVGLALALLTISVALFVALKLFGPGER